MDQILDGRRMKMQPSNDAYIMAEASLFGLDLLTANERHFIHEDVVVQDYKRANSISKTNRDNDIIYVSNQEGRNFVPSPKTLASTISRMKKYVKDKNFEGMYYAQNPNIDENNQYRTV